VGRRTARDNGRSTETNGQRQGLTPSTERHILVTKITHPHKRATTVAPSLPHNPGGPMPNSNFVSFMDDGFHVSHVSPGPAAEIDDRDDPGIPLMLDLSEDHDAILAFKYRTESGSGTLSVKLNSVQLKDIPFGQSEQAVARVWFESIKGQKLNKRHNRLSINVGGSGRVLVSDFKIFYHTV
jgi:hypothetical protein